MDVTNVISHTLIKTLDAIKRLTNKRNQNLIIHVIPMNHTNLMNHTNPMNLTSLIYHTSLINHTNLVNPISLVNPIHLNLLMMVVVLLVKTA